MYPQSKLFLKQDINTGFKELLELSIQTAYQDEPEYGTWKGYRLIAADGSAMRLPSSEEIISEFDRFKPNGTTGTGGNLFIDLCTSLICSARLAAWNVGEQTLAEEQLPEVVTQMRSLNQIIYL